MRKKVIIVVFSFSTLFALSIGVLKIINSYYDNNTNAKYYDENGNEIFG